MTIYNLEFNTMLTGKALVEGEGCLDTLDGLGQVQAASTFLLLMWCTSRHKILGCGLDVRNAGTDARQSDAHAATVTIRVMRTLYQIRLTYTYM